MPTPSRSSAERVYDIAQCTTPPRGDHFAAFQEPVLWNADLQSFLAQLPR